MNPLQTFYNNEVEREAVRAFFVLALRELAADLALDGKPTTGISEAKLAVEKAFDKLDEEFSKPSKVDISNSR